ncbi:META domain-containing protein [Denitrificimonas caeni]|uniref:META domain-containing protein n=1 Tax=Denitrificimonas caeni TaxID=521720 RepID=UPI0003B7A9F0|nr:META domain-containing protein [Denitrificimonas caeni]
MKKLVFIGSAIAILTACSSVPSTQLQPLESYQVEWIGERPLIDRSMLTLTLGDNNQASGLAGCNNWMAKYQLSGNGLRLDNIATTRKLCAPALMEQEQRFLAALATVQRWEFAEHQQLLLWPEQGAAIKLWSIEQP